MDTPRLTLLLPDIRSAHNVGVILRTADAVGAQVWTSGLTPHPLVPDDDRPPYVADRALNLIAKTALGAEHTAFVRHLTDATEAIDAAQSLGWSICALEQSPHSVPLFGYRSDGSILLVLGPEVTGLDEDTLARCDTIIEIPMHGHKESLNVAVAAGIAMYHLARQGDA